MKLTVHFRPQKLSVSFKPQKLSTSTGTPIVRELVEIPAYEGDYMITPAAEAQTIPTKNLRMTDDITVGAIPQNYGLITWDGSTLTVS